MVLEHYSHSADPLDLGNLTRRTRMLTDKPTGLWLSVPGHKDWPTYCRSEGIGGPAPHRHLVTLADDASLLRLTTLEDVMGLGARFPGPDAFGDGFVFAIDWQRIAEQWDGILITPYQGGARFNPLSAWYYSWDCACACIWDARAIASAAPPV